MPRPRQLMHQTLQQLKISPLRVGRCVLIYVSIERRRLTHLQVLVRNVGNETSVASLVNMLEQAGEMYVLNL